MGGSHNPNPSFSASLPHDPRTRNPLRIPTQRPAPLATLRVIPPDQEAQALIDRMNLWNSSLKPWDEYELWLEQGVGQTTLHTDRIHQQEILLRHAQAQRAQLYWDHDHRADVEALAAALMRHPALIISRLRRTQTRLRTPGRTLGDSPGHRRDPGRLVRAQPSARDEPPGNPA